jgi:hypothetical protein
MNRRAFLSTGGAATAGLALWYGASAGGVLTPAPIPDLVFPGASWARGTAAELGMSQRRIEAFALAVGGNGILIRNGYQVAAWGSPGARSEWASAAKPVTTMMLFFAQEEARITSPNDLVSSFGWPLLEIDRPMTLAHLASMVSGYSRKEPPGTAWAYNDYAVELFARTVYDQIFVGRPEAVVNDGARLAALRFQDGSVYGSRDGYGIETSVRDFARIGLLWLARGRWGASQIIPSWYFDAYCRPLVPGALPASASEADLDYLGLGSFGGGTSLSGSLGPGVYGFGWWFNGLLNETSNRLFPSAPHDLYMAQGHFGDETLVVIPSLGLVCACDSTGGWGDITTSAGVAHSTMDTLMAMLAATVEA